MKPLLFVRDGESVDLIEFVIVDESNNTIVYAIDPYKALDLASALIKRALHYFKERRD